MPATDQPLYELIRSLGRNEKRHFKLLSKQKSTKNKGESSKLLQLFDAIDEQKAHYDEAALKEMLNEDKNFHKLKNDLLNKILRTLRSFHTEGIESQFRYYLNDIYYLIDKRLYNIARRRLLSANRIANQYELFEGLFELYRLEGFLSIKSNPTDLPQSVNQSYQTLMDKLLNEKALRDLHDELRSILKNTRSGLTKKQQQTIKKISRHTLLHSPDKALSLRAKDYYFKNHIALSTINNNAPQKIAYAQAWEQLFVENPHLSKMNGRNYATCLLHQAQAMSEDGINKWEEEIEELFSKLDDFYSATDINTQLYINEYIHTPRLAYFFDHKKDEAKGIQLLDDMLSFLRINKDVLSPEPIVSIQVNLIIAYHRLKAYKKAQDIIYELFSSHQKPVREDAICIAEIYDLIILFDMKGKTQLKILKKKLSPLKAKYKKFTGSKYAERAIIRFFEQNIDLPQLSIQEGIKKLKTRLESISKDPQKTSIGVTIYLNWLKQA